MFDIHYYRHTYLHSLLNLLDNDKDNKFDYILMYWLFGLGCLSMVYSFPRRIRTRYWYKQNQSRHNRYPPHIPHIDRTHHPILCYPDKPHTFLFLCYKLASLYQYRHMFYIPGTFFNIVFAVIHMREDSILLIIPYLCRTAKTGPNK